MRRTVTAGMGPRLAAVVLVLSFAGLAIGPAKAADLADRCLEGGGGMFSKGECACLDENAEDDDRGDMLALFTAALKANEAGKPLDDESPLFQKGLITYAGLHKPAFADVQRWYKATPPLVPAA